MSCGEIHLQILCTFLFFLLWSCEWAIKAKFNFGPMDFWWALVDNFIYFIPSYWKFKPNSNISECWPRVMHQFMASQGSMTQLVNSIIAPPLVRVKTEKESFVPSPNNNVYNYFMHKIYTSSFLPVRLTRCENDSVYISFMKYLRVER